MMTCQTFDILSSVRGNAVTKVTCILDVVGSNLGWDTDHSVLGTFLVLCLILSRQVP